MDLCKPTFFLLVWYSNTTIHGVQETPETKVPIFEAVLHLQNIELRNTFYRYRITQNNAAIKNMKEAALEERNDIELREAVYHLDISATHAKEVTELRENHERTVLKEKDLHGCIDIILEELK